DPVPPAAEPEAVPAASSNSLTAMVSDLESAVGEDFLPKPAVAQETHPPAPQPKAPAEPAAQSPAALTEFVSDLEASLGDGFLAEVPASASKAESAAKIATAKIAAGKSAT